MTHNLDYPVEIEENLKQGKEKVLKLLIYLSIYLLLHIH